MVKKKKTATVIKVTPEVLKKPIKACVYVPQFKFRECTITSCKNYSAITDSKCLAIDRVQPTGNKAISDAELHLFKFSGENVTSRFVSIKRKKAVERVKAMLILHAYITWICTKFKPTPGKVFASRQIDKAEAGYPLKVKKLQFKNWMWEHITDAQVFSEFLQKKASGECMAFGVHTLLNMTEMKYAVLKSQVEAQKAPKDETPDQLQATAKGEKPKSKIKKSKSPTSTVSSASIPK